MIVKTFLLNIILSLLFILASIDPLLYKQQKLNKRKALGDPKLKVLNKTPNKKELNDNDTCKFNQKYTNQRVRIHADVVDNAPENTTKNNENTCDIKMNIFVYYNKTNASLPLIKSILYPIKIYNNDNVNRKTAFDDAENKNDTFNDVYLVMNLMEIIFKNSFFLYLSNITGFKIYK